MRNIALQVKPRTKPNCELTRVSCDMKRGGQTVIMRRETGSVDFYRNWTEFKNGFGDLNNDHWIGKVRNLYSYC